MPAQKRPLRINFDETSVCLFQGHGAGNIFIAKRSRPTQNVSRGARRACLTHVAFACDDPTIQPLMPQIIIANERTIPKRQITAIRRSLRRNILVIRAKSAWVNGSVCAQIVRLLLEALAPRMHEFQPILSFDANRAHCGLPVLRALIAAKMWPLLVPASTTRHVQVLDTHGFAAYKLCLQRKYQAKRIQTTDGVVGVAELVDAIQETIKDTLDSKIWSTAFDYNGFGLRQAGVSPKLLATLGVVEPVAIPADRPSDEQVLSCFPRGAKPEGIGAWLTLDVEVASASRIGPPGWARLRPIQRSLQVASVLTPLVSHAVSAREPEDSGIASRTRSQRAKH